MKNLRSGIAQHSKIGNEPSALIHYIENEYSASELKDLDLTFINWD